MLKAAGEEAFVVWDESVLEKASSLTLRRAMCRTLQCGTSVETHQTRILHATEWPDFCAWDALGWRAGDGHEWCAGRRRHALVDNAARCCKVTNAARKKSYWSSVCAVGDVACLACLGSWLCRCTLAWDCPCPQQSVCPALAKRLQTGGCPGASPKPGKSVAANAVEPVAAAGLAAAVYAGDGPHRRPGRAGDSRADPV